MKTEVSTLENKLSKAITSFLKKSDTEKYHVEITEMISYDDFLTNKMLIITAIRVGIPYSLFDLIMHYTPFTETNWAQFLDISTKSLQRYKTTASHSFKPSHSEKIIEMAEVTKVGLDVFGNMDKLRLWLNTPNYALGNLQPIELLKDSYGKELVISELVRIEHGIFV